MTNADQPSESISSAQNGLIPWNRAFIRSGFCFQSRDASFDFSRERLQNRVYLQTILTTMGQHENFDGNVFSPTVPTVDESVWLATIESSHKRAEGGDFFDLEIMDTYMAGIVRWLNIVGIETAGSCDGHATKEPYLWVGECQGALLDYCLQVLSSSRKWRFSNCREITKHVIRNNRPRSVPDYDRNWLLDVGEEVHRRQKSLTELVVAAKKIAYPRE